MLITLAVNYDDEEDNEDVDDDDDNEDMTSM